jgi:tetratricopeptide (TPR) repeat protein
MGVPGMRYAKSFIPVICWLCTFVADQFGTNAAVRTDFSLRTPYSITLPNISPDRRQELESMLPTLDARVQSDPANPDAYCARAVVFLELGKWNLAISDAGNAIRLDPQSSKAHACLGTALAVMGEHELAVPELAKSIDLGADKSTTYKMLAMCRIGLRDFDGAHRDLDAAIATANDEKLHRGMLHALRGLVRFVKGDAKNAATDFDQVLQTHPYSPSAYQVRGMFHLMQQDDQKAIADFEQALRLDNPRAPRYRTFVALLSAGGLPVEEAESPDLAHGLCERTDWKNWLALAIYADWLFEQGRYDEGAEWLSKSIELAPDNMRDRLRERQQFHQRRSPFSPPGY